MEARGDPRSCTVSVIIQICVLQLQLHDITKPVRCNNRWSLHRKTSTMHLGKIKVRCVLQLHDITVLYQYDNVTATDLRYTVTQISCSYHTGLIL